MLPNSVGRIPWPCLSVDELSSLPLSFFSVVVHDKIQAAIIASFLCQVCVSVTENLTDVVVL